MVVTLAAAKQVAVILVIRANPPKVQEKFNHSKCTKQFTKKKKKNPNKKQVKNKKQIIGNNLKTV